MTAQLVQECPSFLSCEASLCPLDASLKRAVWFPGEEFCRQHRSLAWVRAQRRISKVCGTTTRCFRLADLEVIRRVDRRVVPPIDPDKGDTRQNALGQQKVPPFTSGTKDARGFASNSTGAGGKGGILQADFLGAVR